MSSFFSRPAMIQRYREMAALIVDERTRKALLDLADEYERMETAEASFPSAKRGSKLKAYSRPTCADAIVCGVAPMTEVID